MRFLPLLVAALYGLGVTACSQEKDDAEGDEDGACLALSQAPRPGFNLVNGVATTDHDAVGQIVAVAGDGYLYGCTGTFVSATTMITAAHCVRNTPNGDVYFVPGNRPDLQMFELSGIAATKVFHLGYTVEELTATPDPTDDMRLSDMAVLVFPEATAAAVVGVSAAAPAINEPITLVGYGQQHLADDGVTDDSVRMVGTNVVAATPTDPSFLAAQLHFGFITEAQSHAAKGELALIAHGDSGGPVLSDNRLAGIFSQGGSYDLDGMVYYFGNANSTNGAKAAELFAAARAGGAVIPLPGAAPADEELANYDHLDKDAPDGVVATGGTSPVRSTCLH